MWGWEDIFIGHCMATSFGMRGVDDGDVAVIKYPPFIVDMRIPGACCTAASSRWQPRALCGASSTVTR
jgi:hypothetical protein